MDYLFLFLLLGVTSVVAYALVSYFIPRLIRLGITGCDIHKPDRPKRAEMGGISILIASIVGLLIAFPLLDPLSPTFYAGFLTVVLAGVVGMIDDLFEIRQRYKPFLIALTSSPLVLVLWGRSSVSFPIVGSIPFGLLYPLLVVPLAVTTSANFTNMLAGFNGLEAGNASLGIATLTILSWLKGNSDGMLIGILFLGGYLAFLRYNWYPAKIFPGDTGTLMAGAAIAAIGLASGLEFVAIVVSMPAAFDFTLKMLSRRPFAQRTIMGDTTVTYSGRLIPPPYPALAHAFMKVAEMTEKSLVKSILLMEFTYCTIAILVTELMM